MKKLMFSIAAVAIMGAASYVAFRSNNTDREFTALELANIEALTNGEGAGFTCRWSRLRDAAGCTIYVCNKDGNGDSCECGDVKYL